MLLFLKILIYHFDILVARLRELAFLNKGIHLSITDKRRKDDEGEFVKEEFYSEGGLKEFVSFWMKQEILF